jgi:hypothetical protein
MMKKLWIASCLLVPSFVLAAGEAEKIKGHFTTQGSVHIQVKSNGCTFKKNFEVKSEMKGDVRELSFYRMKPDACRAHVPYGELLTFTFEELNLKAGEKFFVGNPEANNTVSNY